MQGTGTRKIEPGELKAFVEGTVERWSQLGIAEETRREVHVVDVACDEARYIRDWAAQQAFLERML